MRYTNKNYTFSISLNCNGFYIGHTNFSFGFDPRAITEKPRLYRQNPKTFVGFGLFIRMEPVRGL